MLDILSFGAATKLTIACDTCMIASIWELVVTCTVCCKGNLVADLPGMGGLDVLIDCLLEQGDLQLQALRVIHTAAANNEKFQLKLFEKEAAIVPWLLQVLTLVRNSVGLIVLRHEP